MKCVNCGYEINSDSNECPKCGYKVDTEQIINKKNVALAGGSVLAAGLSIAGINKLANGNKTKADAKPIIEVEEDLVVDNTPNDDFNVEENIPEEVTEDVAEEVIVEDNLEDDSNISDMSSSNKYNDPLEIDNSNKKPSSNDKDDSKVEDEKEETEEIEDEKEETDELEDEIKEETEEEEKETIEEYEEEFVGYSADNSETSGAGSGSSDYKSGNVDFYFNYASVDSAIKTLSEVSSCSSGNYNMNNIFETVESIFDNQHNNTVYYGESNKSNKDNTNLKNNIRSFNGENGFLQSLTSTLQDVWSKATANMTEEEIDKNISAGIIENLATYGDIDLDGNGQNDYLERLVDLGYADSVESLIAEYSSTAVEYAQTAAAETESAEEYDYTSSATYKAYQALTGRNLSKDDVVAMERDRLDNVAGGLWVGMSIDAINGNLNSNGQTLENFTYQQLNDGLKDEEGNYINQDSKSEGQKKLEKLIYGLELKEGANGDKEVLELLQGSIKANFDPEHCFPGDHVYEMLETGFIEGYFNENGEPIDFFERYDCEGVTNISEAKSAEGYEYVNRNKDMFNQVLESRTEVERMVCSPREEYYHNILQMYDKANPELQLALETAGYAKTDEVTDSQGNITESANVLIQDISGGNPVYESKYTPEEYKDIKSRVEKALEDYEKASNNISAYNSMFNSEYSVVNMYQQYIVNPLNEIINENSNILFDASNNLNYEKLFELFDEKINTEGNLPISAYLDMTINGNYDAYMYAEDKQVSGAINGNQINTLSALTYTNEDGKEINIGSELVATLSSNFGDTIEYKNEIQSYLDFNELIIPYSIALNNDLKSQEDMKKLSGVTDLTALTPEQMEIFNKSFETARLLDEAAVKLGDALDSYYSNEILMDDLKKDRLDFKQANSIKYSNNRAFELTEREQLFLDTYETEHSTNLEIVPVVEEIAKAYDKFDKIESQEQLMNVINEISTLEAEKTRKEMMVFEVLDDMNDVNWKSEIAKASIVFESLVFYDSNNNIINNLSSEEKALYIALNYEEYGKYMYALSINERDYVNALMENSNFILKGLSYINNTNPNEFSNYFKSIVEGGSLSLAKKTFEITQQRYDESGAIGDFWWTLLESAKAGGNQIKYGFVNLFDADGIRNRVDYHNALVSNYLSQEMDSKFLYHTYNVSTSIVNMLPTIALSVAIPGVGRLLGSGFMWITSAGNATEDFMQQGLSHEEALFFGAISGTIEVGLQSIFGSKYFGGVKFNGLKDAIAKSLGLSTNGTLRNMVYEQFMEAIGEGIEEFSQEVIGTWLINLANMDEIEESYFQYKDLVSKANDQNLSAEEKTKYLEELRQVYLNSLYENELEGSANSMSYNTYISFDNWLKLNKNLLENDELFNNWINVQGENASNPLEWYWTNREKVNWGAAVQAGIYGAVSSLIMGASSAGIKTASYIKSKHSGLVNAFMQSRIEQGHYYDVIGNIIALSNYMKGLSNSKITDINPFLNNIKNNQKFEETYSSYYDYMRANGVKESNIKSRDELALQMFVELTSKMNSTILSGLNPEYLRAKTTSYESNIKNLYNINKEIELLNEKISKETNKETKENLKKELIVLKSQKNSLESSIKEQEILLKRELANFEMIENMSEMTPEKISLEVKSIQEQMSEITQKINDNNRAKVAQENNLKSLGSGFVDSTTGKHMSKEQKSSQMSKAQKEINRITNENAELESKLSELKSNLLKMKMYELLSNPNAKLSSLTNEEFNYFISYATTGMIDLYSNEIVESIKNINEENIQDFYDKMSDMFANGYKNELYSNLDNISDENIRNKCTEILDSKVSPENFYASLFDLYNQKYKLSEEELAKLNKENPGLIQFIKNKFNEAKTKKEDLKRIKNEQSSELRTKIRRELELEIQSIRQEIEERPKPETAKSKDKIQQRQSIIDNLEAKITDLRNIYIELSNNLNDPNKSITNLSTPAFNRLVNIMTQENITTFSSEIMTRLNEISNDNFVKLLEKMSLDTIYKYKSNLSERINSIEENTKESIKLKETANSLLINGINDYIDIKAKIEETVDDAISSDLNIVQTIKNKIDSLLKINTERVAKINETREEIKNRVLNKIDEEINQRKERINKLENSNKTNATKVRKTQQEIDRLNQEINNLNAIKEEINNKFSNSKTKLSRLSKETLNYLYENMSDEEIAFYTPQIISGLNKLSNENFKIFVENLSEETIYNYKDKFIRRASIIIKDVNNREYILNLIEQKNNNFNVKTNSSVETVARVVVDETINYSNIDVSLIVKIVNLLSGKVSEKTILEFMSKNNIKDLSSESLNEIILNLDTENLNNSEVLSQIMEVINKVRDNVVLGLINNLTNENLTNNKVKLKTRVNNISSNSIKTFTQGLLVNKLFNNNIDLESNNEISSNKKTNEKIIELIQNNDKVPTEVIIDILKNSMLTKEQKTKITKILINNYVKNENRMFGILNNQVQKLINNVNELISNYKINNSKINTLETKLKNIQININNKLKTLNLNISKLRDIVNSFKSDFDLIKKLYNGLNERVSDCLNKINEIKNLAMMHINNIVGIDNILYNSVLSAIESNTNLNSKKFREKFNKLIQAVDIDANYELLQRLMDSVTSRMMNGFRFDRETYKTIFESEIFSADNTFAIKYLNHYLAEMVSSEVADSVTKIYEAARRTTREGMSDLYSYCDHTEGHVLQVAYFAMHALNVQNDAIRNNAMPMSYNISEEYKMMFLAGLLHDLGMAAKDANTPGMNAYLVETADGKIKLEIKQIRELSNPKDSNAESGSVRENHTLNSALQILLLRNKFDAKKINVDKLSLLALIVFSHSKSNSGVVDLTQKNDWSFSVEKIIESVKEWNNTHEEKIEFNENNVLAEVDTSETNRKRTSKQKIKKPKGRKEYYAYDVKFDSQTIMELPNLGLAIRVGDAYVSKGAIKLKNPITWKYNNKIYKTDRLVKAQTGVYMAYDSSIDTYRMEDIETTEDIESNNYGAYIYFKLDENGNILPWNAKNPETVYTIENGAFVITEENEDCLMSRRPITKKAKIIGKNEEVKCILIEGNKYFDQTTNTIYTLSETTNTFINPERIQNPEEVKIVYSTSGQFLAGESNVMYWYDFKDGKIISEFYIKSIRDHIVNTIAKGINERFGEIKSAAGVKNYIDVKVNMQEILEYFLNPTLENNPARELYDFMKHSEVTNPMYSFNINGKSINTSTNFESFVNCMKLYLLENIDTLTAEEIKIIKSKYGTIRKFKNEMLNDIVKDGKYTMDFYEFINKHLSNMKDVYYKSIIETLKRNSKEIIKIEMDGKISEKTLENIFNRGNNKIIKALQNYDVKNGNIFAIYEEVIIDFAKSIINSKFKNVEIGIDLAKQIISYSEGIFTNNVYNESGNVIEAGTFLKEINKLNPKQLRIYNELVRELCNSNNEGMIGNVATDFYNKILGYINEMNESGDYKLNVEEELYDVFLIATRLCPANSSIKTINHMVSDLIGNMFYSNYYIQGSHADIINYVINNVIPKLNGINLKELIKIDEENATATIDEDIAKIFNGSLNNFEVRMIYNYLEIILEGKVKQIKDSTIEEKIKKTKIAYNLRNNLRIISQTFMLGETTLPPTGTNPFNRSFEGTIVYNTLRAIANGAIKENNINFTNIIKVIANNYLPELNNYIAVDNAKVKECINKALKEHHKISDANINILYNEIIKFSENIEDQFSDILDNIQNKAFSSNQDVNKSLNIILLSKIKNALYGTSKSESIIDLNTLEEILTRDFYSEYISNISLDDVYDLILNIFEKMGYIKFDEIDRNKTSLENIEKILKEKLVMKMTTDSNTVEYNNAKGKVIAEFLEATINTILFQNMSYDEIATFIKQINPNFFNRNALVNETGYNNYKLSIGISIRNGEFKLNGKTTWPSNAGMKLSGIVYGTQIFDRLGETDANIVKVTRYGSKTGKSMTVSNNYSLYDESARALIEIYKDSDVLIGNFNKAKYRRLMEGVAYLYNTQIRKSTEEFNLGYLESIFNKLMPNTIIDMILNSNIESNLEFLLKDENIIKALLEEFKTDPNVKQSIDDYNNRKIDITTLKESIKTAYIRKIKYEYEFNERIQSKIDSYIKGEINYSVLNEIIKEECIGKIESEFEHSSEIKELINNYRNGKIDFITLRDIVNKAYKEKIEEEISKYPNVLETYMQGLESKTLADLRGKYDIGYGVLGTAVRYGLSKGGAPQLTTPFGWNYLEEYGIITLDTPSS